MNTFVALLRGINVGGNAKVQMSKLKSEFESLGYINVQTYINSGNIVFQTNESDCSKITNTIEQQITKAFGFSIRVAIRDINNIQLLCKEIPAEWINNSETKTDVLFLWEEFNNKDVLGEIGFNQKVDRLLYLQGCVVWHIDRKDYSKSGMRKFIGTKIYKNMTARNINTVRKLGEVMNSI
jgi:uncharacterized protein (DUF1697 family)